MKPFLFLLLLFPSLVFAQLDDHFDNSDLTRNPSWKGTLSRFKVNRQHQLQLNDSVSDTAWISTSFPMSSCTEWHVWVKAAFSPSSKNFIRIFLAADRPDLNKTEKAYFLQLGETGTNDALELFRKSHDSLISVCRGTDGELAKAFTVRIKIIRDSSGKWQMWTDNTGGENFKKEAEGMDNRYRDLNYFGLWCSYTKSYARKIYFDNVYAGTPVTDTVPPHVDSLLFLNDSTLQVFFDEKTDRRSAVDTARYQLVPSAGNIKKVQLSDDGKIVTLIFSDTFQRNRNYTLTISGISDPAGNVMKTQTLSFVFVRPQLYDVVFNEIMADPSPPEGLPNAEYLELYNRTSVAVSLNHWKLYLGKSVRIFGKTEIEPHGFLIVCKSGFVKDFSAYGKVYGFSSFSLTNTGETLRLFDGNGTLISSVSYNKSWYHNAAKENGGWSLEQKNPENVCSGEDNWTASVNTKGGTPGSRNSVYDPQIIYPEVIKVGVPDENTLQLSFSQKMDSLSLGNASFYTFSSGNFQVEKITVNKNSSAVNLKISPAMDTASVCLVTVLHGLQNCAGKTLVHDTVIRFGLPQPVNNKDVVINEVLYNPLEGGTDYVELFNRSHKIIDVSTLLLGTVKIAPPGPPDSLFYDLTFDQQLFFPGDYLVLTASPEKVKAQYKIKNPHAFMQVKPFPVFKKDHGSVLLYRQLHKIDAFDYSEKMQYPLLNYTKGVALERVNPDGATNNFDNWHSAAESAGFGTPGYRNSQYVDSHSDTLGGTIEIKPGIFSPDNDGYQDVLHIFYRFKKAGNTVSIRVFNAAGQPVRQLVNNEYAGTRGVFLWDGLQDDGTKAPAGIYVLFIRVFDTKGHVFRFKKTAVLATKL